MAFARTVATTHTKTLIAPDTGVEDKVYGADYVSASSHTATPAVSGATSGGIPYFDSATSEASSALLAQYGVVVGGGAGAAPATSSGLTFGGAAAGTGLAIAAGTATTDVAAFSLTRTNNNAAVATGVKWTFTDTTSAAGFLPFQILGGSAGTTNLFSVSKLGALSTTNGVDTITIKGDNAFTSSITANNALLLLYSNAGDAAIGVGQSSGTPGSARVVQYANGVTLSRYGIAIGRHAANTVTGPAGFMADSQTADDVVTDLVFKAGGSYPQSTVNTSGGNLTIAGGVGRRFFTVVDWTQLGGKTITVNVNGTSTTKTEGVNWTAAVSNAATASSIVTAFTGISGFDTPTAVGAVVYFQPSNTYVTWQLELSTNATAPGGTVTTGNNGVVRMDPARAVANLPTASTSLTGSRATVSDSNAASFTAGIGAIVAAGGTTVVPVFCDGTNWRIG